MKDFLIAVKVKDLNFTSIYLMKLEVLGALMSFGRSVIRSGVRLLIQVSDIR